MSIAIERRTPIHALTGLRFVAALLVYVSHFPIPGVPTSLLHVAENGYCGVTFFFILSGFVLAYNYAEYFVAPSFKQISGYLFARFARIYPLYLLCTMFVWSIRGSNVDLWRYVLLVQAWSGDLLVAYGLDAPAWSISVEAFLYLMFPVVMFGLTRLKSKRSLAIVMAATIVIVFIAAGHFAIRGEGPYTPLDPTSSHRWLYRNPGMRLFDFVLGCSLALWCIKLKPTKALLKVTSTFTYLAVGCVVLLISIPGVLNTAFSWDAAYILPFGVLIACLAINTETRISKFLGSNIVVRLGEISFAFYLLHLLFKAGGITTVTEPLTFPIGAYAISLLFTIFTSAGAHAIIERPCQKLLLILARRFLGFVRPEEKRRIAKLG